MPTVPSREQCECLLGCLDERSRLMAARMGGAGLRLLELVRLLVHDVDLPRPRVSVRSGKGVKGAPPNAAVRCARLFCTTSWHHSARLPSPETTQIYTHVMQLAQAAALRGSLHMSRVARRTAVCGDARVSPGVFRRVIGESTRRWRSIHDRLAYPRSGNFGGRGRTAEGRGKSPHCIGWRTRQLWSAPTCRRSSRRGLPRLSQSLRGFAGRRPRQEWRDRSRGVKAATSRRTP